ncbi:hypothetical protein F5Y09DRAFT_303769, partial [Xylaria sp. FL1042]
MMYHCTLQIDLDILLPIWSLGWIVGGVGILRDSAKTSVGLHGPLSFFFSPRPLFQALRLGDDIKQRYTAGKRAQAEQGLKLYLSRLFLLSFFFFFFTPLGLDPPASNL